MILGQTLLWNYIPCSRGTPLMSEGRLPFHSTERGLDSLLCIRLSTPASSAAAYLLQGCHRFASCVAKFTSVNRFIVYVEKKLLLNMKS